MECRRKGGQDILRSSILVDLQLCQCSYLGGQSKSKQIKAQVPLFSELPISLMSRNGGLASSIAVMIPVGMYCTYIYCGRTYLPLRYLCR
jgi:hypothetical protein